MKALTIVLNTLFHLGLSAYCLNLFLSGSCEAVSFYGELLGELAVAENLKTVHRIGDKAALEKNCLVNNSAVLKFVECRNINDCVINSEVVLKASLRKSSVKRDLTALEAGAYSAAGTSVLAFMTFTGGLSVAGTGTSAYAEGCLDRALGR